MSVEEKDNIRENYENIQNMTEKPGEVSVPESLQPEHIMETIRRQEIKEKSRKEHSRKRWMTGVAGIAVAGICIGTGVFAWQNFNEGTLQQAEKDTEEQTQKQKEKKSDTKTGEQNEKENDSEKDSKEDADISPEKVETLSSYDVLYRKQKLREAAQKIADAVTGRRSYQSAYKGLAINSMDDMAVAESTDAGTSGIANKNIASVPKLSENKVDQYQESESGQDYSGTNVRTEGIDEADLLKQDGEYLYYLKNGDEGTELEIVKADGTDTEVLSSTDLESFSGEIDWGRTVSDVTVSDECYLYQDYLVITMETADYYWYGPVYYNDLNDGVQIKSAVLEDAQEETQEESREEETQEESREEETQEESKDETEEEYPKDQGCVAIIDVSDKTAPELLSYYLYDGDLVESRLQGNLLYIVNQRDIDYSEKDRIPACVNGAEVPAANVYLMEQNQYESYTTLATLDLDVEGDIADVYTYAAGGYPELYMSADNMYLYAELYGNFDETRSCIVKVGVTDGEFHYQNCTKIKGYLNDQFSMDEYQGYLRTVVTEENWDNYTYEESNSIYVLDEELNCIAKLGQIAEDERIYSARFDGDIAYFVTYRQTDPLFCVDLSDPANPKILGYLEIPGYSSYLEILDDTHVLGLGYDEYNQVKVSLFDTTDPEDMKELAVLHYENSYYSEAADNHKAILYDKKKQIFGFDVRKSVPDGIETAYVVLSYQDGVIKECANISLSRQDSWSWTGDGVRGAYNGDYLYVFFQGGLRVYQLSDVLGGNGDNCLKEISF